MGINLKAITTVEEIKSHKELASYLTKEFHKGSPRWDIYIK